MNNCLKLAFTLSLGVPWLAQTGSVTVPAALPMTVWTESVAHKVQPTASPGMVGTIALEGARGSYEAYQIVVHSNSDMLTGVNLTASTLADGAGNTLAGSNINFFREGFIDFTGVSADGGTLPVPAKSPTRDGRIPDPLIPFTDPYSGKLAGAPFTVAPGLNQPVWMDVFIPPSSAPGTYTGTVTVTAMGQPPVLVPIKLVVWNFVLPDMRAVTTYFLLRADELIKFHRDTYQCSGGSCYLDWGSARARTIVKRYEELAHTHRIDTGQSFVTLPDNGCSPPADWSAYDGALQPYLNGTYWSDGVPSNWLETPFTPGANWGPQSECTEAQYTSLATAWASHLKARGWFNRAIVYALDEPDPDDIPTIAQHSKWMQNGDADWKGRIMDTTPPRRSNVAALNPALGIYAACLKCYDKWYYQDGDVYGRAEWPGLFAQNIKLWFYESNAQSAPYPTYATNTLLGIEPRIMKWGAWYESATGFLMWAVNTWDMNNPWGPNILYGKTGDGVLLYPGNHDGTIAPGGSPMDVAIDGPIPSYRLKMIRAGLQDWALFKLADQRGLTSYARAQVGQAYSQLGACDWSGCAPTNGQFYWKADDVLMMQIRRNIALAILAAPRNTGTASTKPTPP